jgi:hypothetical protein
MDSVRIEAGRPLRSLLVWRMLIAMKDNATDRIGQVASGK